MFREQISLAEDSELGDQLIAYLEELCKEFLDIVIDNKARTIKFTSFEVRNIHGDNAEYEQHLQEKYKPPPKP